MALRTILFLGIAALGVASPLRINYNTTATQEPCAVVSNILADIESEGLVTAKQAYDCLVSVPVAKEGDLLQLDGLKVLLQFQSTQAYLKDPPSGYLYPGVDLVAAVETLEADLKADRFGSEYDFQLALYQLISSAHDGHLSYVADILEVFHFGSKVELVSVSIDGRALPQVYTWQDLNGLTRPSNATLGYTPSPVTSIDGQTVEDYLNALAVQINYQDPDANYNALFVNFPSGISQDQGREPSPGSFNTYPGFQNASFVLGFANGTTQEFANFGLFEGTDFSGVVDGPSFFKKFCTGPSSTNSSNASATPTSNFTTTPVPNTPVPYAPVPTQTKLAAPTTYPDPVVIHSKYTISGYFLDEVEGFEDIAILSVPTFDVIDTPVEFENVARSFLATAKAAGKTRLIVDLRGNGGGLITLGYDLFKQVFPDVTPYGGSNEHAHPLFNLIGQSFTELFSNVSFEGKSEEQILAEYPDLTLADAVSLFNTEGQLTSTLQPLASWSEFYGPASSYNGDNFTSVTRYNLTSNISTIFKPIDGYGAYTSLIPYETFAAENITLLQDGKCSSTCALFSEMMKTSGSVQQIVIGGRPQTGPMQSVGGVKGSQILYGEDLYQYITDAYNYASPALQAEFNKTVDLESIANIEHTLLRVSSSSNLGFNVRNQIRRGDESHTPLQFVYEAADCRIWYTPQMFVDQREVWKAAYEARWGEGLCVEGSTGHPSSLSGSAAVLDVDAGMAA